MSKQRRKSRARLTTRYRDVDDIGVSQGLQMYDIFQRYYDQTSLEVFLDDLSEKSGAFLITRRDDGRVVGFSTVTTIDFEVDGQPTRGVFSGDTVLEREYWGDRSLQLQFFLFLIRQKLAQPHRPLYWLLISKGYKTYLLLSNNFPQYYPHPEGQQARLGRVAEAYGQRLFGDLFDPETGLVDFGDDHECLKGGVAEITEEMRRNEPKIQYFEECNPTWRDGTELVCVGVVTIPDIFRHAIAFTRKAARGRSPKRRHTSAA